MNGEHGKNSVSQAQGASTSHGQVAQPEMTAEEKKREAQKKKKEEKLKRAKEGMKKPLSPYMLYNNFRRPVLKNDHPGKACIKFVAASTPTLERI